MPANRKNITRLDRYSCGIRLLLRFSMLLRKRNPLIPKMGHEEAAQFFWAHGCVSEWMSAAQKGPV